MKAASPFLKRPFCDARSQKILLALISITLLLVAYGCAALRGKGAPSAESGRVKALATLSVLANMVEEVGKDRVKVTPLVPVGREAHTYQPTPGDAMRIQEADVIFYNGLGLEGPLEGVVRGAIRKGVPIVVLSQGVLSRKGDVVASHEGNPHLWLDVRNAVIYVEQVKDALASVDPEGAAEYEANARAYIEELEKLDQYIEDAVSSIPKERRKLVVFHDAFPYFAERYGLEIVGLVLKSPGREPSAREVAELTEKIKAEAIATVYIEPQFNAQVLELAARDAGARIATLYSDALDSNAPTYIEMMRYNTQRLLEGLK